MGDKGKCAFDDFFEGNKKPALFEDKKYMHENKEVDDSQAKAENEDCDYDHEYTVRKFSTFSRNQSVVDEGQERKSSKNENTAHPPLFCTALLGISSTGKTSLCNQFSTCAHVNTFDEVQEEVNRETQLGLEVDGWKCRLHMVDFPGSFAHSLVQRDETCSARLDSYDPVVLLVVFAVDNKRSLEMAWHLLAMLRGEDRLSGKVVVLVANKTDLVRSRVVREAEGKTLAGRFGVSYMETSAGINYNVDEPLVKIVEQVKMDSEEEQEVRGKKMSITERIKDLAMRKKSRKRTDKL